jgi:hypothetical protein
MRSYRSAFGVGVLAVAIASPLSAQAPGSYRARSPGTALAMSAFGTLVPIGLVVGGAAGDQGGGLLLGGLLLGPSLGYLYGGETGRGLKGIGVRAGVLAVTGLAAAGICSSGCDFWGDDNGAVGAAAVVLLGLVTTSVLAIRDVVRVDDAIRTRNEKRALAVRLTYSPELRAPGVLLTLRR